MQVFLTAAYAFRAAGRRVEDGSGGDSQHDMQHGSVADGLVAGYGGPWRQQKQRQQQMDGRARVALSR
jgi:hypothetical protein